MRLLTLAALAAFTLSAQNAPTSKAEKPTDRPLTNTEKMTLQLAHKSVLLFQEQYKVKEHQQALQDYQKAIAADQKTQYDTIISVCGSIGLTEKDLGQCGLSDGLDPDGKPLTGENATARVWKIPQAPPAAAPPAATPDKK